MSWPQSPEWLLELQARFGDLLRTPLSRAGGSLHAETSAYPTALTTALEPTPALSSAERLAVYHRQYWFRLFTVLQGLFPLTARLVGYWRFNEFAAAHLIERPPRGFDIDDIGEGFEQTLSLNVREHGDVTVAPGSRIPVEALLDAARIDAGFHRVLRAPQPEPFHPSPDDVARFDSSCLVLSPAVALLRERWPLCERRASFIEQPSDEPITLGAPWPTARHWLLARHGTRLGLLSLEPREAELIGLLQLHPLEQALGLLEASAGDEERAKLPEQAQAWLSRSVRLGVWSGLAAVRE